MSLRYKRILLKLSGEALNGGDKSQIINPDILENYAKEVAALVSAGCEVAIVIGGGNIFRFIPGPDRFAELEPYIEASHSFRAEGIAKNFGLSYYSADDAATLQAILPVFFGSENKNTPSLLEIVTPPKISAQVLKDYSKFIKS